MDRIVQASGDDSTLKSNSQQTRSKKRSQNRSSNNQEQSQSGVNFKGVLVFISGCIWMVFLSSQFMISELSPYIQSYYRVSDETTWLIRPILNTVFMPFVILGSHLAQNNFNPKLQYIIGGGIGILGVFFSSFTKNYHLFVILFPVLFGACSGMTYMVAMNIAWQYYPGREGFVSGIIDTSFGIGGAIFGWMMYEMINPEHTQAQTGDDNDSYSADESFPFEEEIANKLPSSFRFVSLIWAIMVIICVLLIQKGPQSTQPGEQRLETHETQSEVPRRSKKSFLSVVKYLKTRQFVTLWLMTFLSINMSTFTIGNYAQYGQKYIDDSNLIVWIGSVGSVCTCLRFAWSLPLDYYPFKYVYGFMLFLEIVLSFTMPLAVKNEGTYLIWVALSYWAEGGHFTLAPAIYKKIFKEEGARVFGVGFSFLGIASLFQIFLIWALGDYIGIAGIYYIFGVFCVLAFLILICFFEQKVVDLSDEVPVPPTAQHQAAQVDSEGVQDSTDQHDIKFDIQ